MDTCCVYKNELMYENIEKFYLRVDPSRFWRLMLQQSLEIYYTIFFSIFVPLNFIETLNIRAKFKKNSKSSNILSSDLKVQ